MSDGLFTATLDFGAGAFSGAPRFLQIEVRTTVGAFFALTPRQALTPAPFALTTGVATTASGLKLPFSGSASSSDPAFTVANSGTGPAGVFLCGVGIGTTNPQSLLHVNGSLQWGGTTADYMFSGEDGLGAFFEQHGTSPAISSMRFQSSKSGDAANYSQFFIDPNSGFSFRTLGTGNGRVGIGTPTPQATLDVRGDIRLGPSGEFRATSGEENLRIVRGRISGMGGPLAGSGFNVAHNATSPGFYSISFEPPFRGKPAVTVTVEVTSSAQKQFATVFIPAFNSAIFINLHDISTGNSVDNDFTFIAIGAR